MIENDKQAPSEEHSDGGKDPSAEFVRDLATSAPPKSVETVKAASDAHEKSGDEGHEERVRRRAYELWEQDGSPHGKHDDYWLRAEAELAGSGSDGGV